MICNPSPGLRGHSHKLLPTLIAIAPVIALGLLGLAESQSPEATKMIQAEMKGQCVTCHKPFVDEWKASGHAAAWKRAPFQQQAGKNAQRVEQCDGCHAPMPVLIGGLDKQPKSRGATAPDSGVMCVTCHMDANGAMHGPFDGESDFHKTVKDKNYTQSNAVCVSCHGQVGGVGVEFNQITSFADYAKGNALAACSDCHMRPVERQASTEDGKPKRMCAKHDWHGAYDANSLQSAINLTVRLSGTTATASIANLTGHLLPAGAWRQAILEITANGQVVKREVFTKEFGGATDTRLKPLERKRVTAEVPAGAKVAARLWWKLMPDTPDQERKLMAEAEIK